MSRSFATTAALGAFAACLSVASLAFAGEPTPAAGGDSYRPIQSLTYDFGAKSTSGYFVPENGSCRVVLMVADKVDPESAAAQPSPTRLRLTLAPGQVASLDSEQGQSLSIACGAGATALLVTAGPTEALMSGACDAGHGCSKLALQAK